MTLAGGAAAAEKMRALIVDGQNNHEVWPKSTIMMKHDLEETGLFAGGVRAERVRRTSCASSLMTSL